MPKGNGDMVLTAELQGGQPGQEHGECRKAMETFIRVNGV